MMIYKFVVISGEDENFVREFELHEENSLMDFHNILQDELEYDKSQMATFFTTSTRWEKEEEFTLFDMGSNTTVMEDVIIDDVVIEKNQKLLYIFDLFNERALFIECTGTTDEVDDREYPVCTRSHGMPPQQVVLSGFSTRNYQESDYLEDDLINDGEPDLSDFDNIEDFEDI
ncbi:MAG TPA: hypothetical protein VMW76_01420 [Bacteroidales bacterium]|nr:hypothetical protein [Bacteroidales bacterium]